MIDPEHIERIKRLREQIIEKTKIFILIWGPHPDSITPAAKKRLTLRNTLAGIFGEGNVAFSEDPELQGLREEIGGYAAEYYQVKQADVVILIAESIGSITEGALYQDELAGKVLVFTEYRPAEQQGFAQEAYLPLKVIFVAPEESHLQGGWAN